MKKEEMELKEVIKAAILEAFAEMYGVATMTEGQPDVPQPDNENNGEGSNTGSNTGGNNSGHGNNNNNGMSDENSGGGLNNGRPIPDAGVGTFGRR